MCYVVPSNAARQAAWPRLAAQWRAVRPSLSWLAGSAPRSSSACTAYTEPALAAHSSGSRPSRSRAVRSTPGVASSRCSPAWHTACTAVQCQRGESGCRKAMSNQSKNQYSSSPPSSRPRMRRTSARRSGRVGHRGCLVVRAALLRPAAGPAPPVHRTLCKQTIR